MSRAVGITVPRRAEATALGGSEPDGEGFRLAGAEESFLVGGPPGATVVVSLQRTAGDAGDEVRWGPRRLRLGRLPAPVLQLPMAEAVTLGTTAVVPVFLRSEGAWIRFSSD